MGKQLRFNAVKAPGFGDRRKAMLYQILLSKPTYNLQVKNSTLHTKSAYAD